MFKFDFVDYFEETNSQEIMVDLVFMAAKVTAIIAIVLAARHYLLQKAQMFLDLKQDLFLQRNRCYIWNTQILQDFEESQTPICISGTTFCGDACFECCPFLNFGFFCSLVISNWLASY